MDRDEALRLLMGGPDGVAEWNRRRDAGEEIPHLDGADLDGADLSGADLSGADLREARHLTQEQLDLARGDKYTKLPPNLVRPKSWTKDAAREFWRSIKRQWDHSPPWLRWSTPYLLLLLVVAGGLLVSFIKIRNQHKVFIYSGPRGGTAYRMGYELAKILNDNYNSELSSYWKRRLSFCNQATKGSAENLRKLEEGTPALALVQDGLLPPRHAKAILHLYESYLHVIINNKINFNQIDKLCGCKLYLGAEENAARQVMKDVLRHYGVEPRQTVHDDKDLKKAAELMIHRPNEIEAAVFLVGLDSIAVKELAEPGGFTFLTVDRAKAIDLRYEYLREAIIPKAIYESREPFPNNDIKTVSSATILACHGKMEKDSVREILKSLHEHHRDMAVALQRPPIADPQDPQKSFLYPLHSAALEFYKNESPPPFFTLSILLSLAGLTSISTAQVRANSYSEILCSHFV